MRLVPLGLALVAACGGRVVDYEPIGDAAWTVGNPQEALVAWRQAGTSSRVLVKRAEAALAAGHLTEAATTWGRLAANDTTWRGEAAAGLARTAAAAERRGEALALRQAILGLREVAPLWPVGRLALSVALSDDLAASDAAELVPIVLATNPGPTTTRQVLERLATAERLLGQCDKAVPIFELVARRGGTVTATPAGEGLATCELALGLTALATDRREAAREWLERAAGRAPDAPAGRRALVALGDIHAADGDPFAAALTWQSVVAARVAPDSITSLALERLRSVPFEPGATDSLERP